MKLNPSKCAFGVASRKFLGFIVSQRGIEANPENVLAILDMTPPKTIKYVQKLIGSIAALNRFVSKAKDKCLPFFKTLKKAFAWIDECEVAFVSGSISHSRECSLGSRRGQETTPNLLRQPSFPRGRSQVPKD